MILIGVAVWLGGASLGLWNSGFAAVDGAFVAGAAEAGAGSALTAAESATMAESAAAGLASAPESLAIAEGVAGTAATPGVTAAVPGMNAVSGGHAAAETIGAGVVEGAVEEGARTGIINSLLSGAKAVGSFAAANPYPTAMITSAVGAALTPDAQDLQENQWEREDEERRRRLLNMDVSGVELGHRPAARENIRTSPNPVNTSMSQGVG